MPSLITLKPGDQLFKEGDPSGTFYHIKQGALQVYRMQDDVEIMLETVHAGDFLGTVTIFTGEPRSASVRAQTQALLECYDQESFQTTFERMPVWAKGMIKDIVTRLKRINNVLVQTSLSEQVSRQFKPTPFSLTANLCRLMRLWMRDQSAGAEWQLDKIRQDIAPVLHVPMETIFSILGILVACPLLKASFKDSSFIWQPEPKDLDDIIQHLDQLNLNPQKNRIPSAMMPWIKALSELAQPPCGGVLWQDLSFSLMKKSGCKPDMALKESFEKGLWITQAPNQSNTLLYDPIQLGRLIHYETLASELETLTDGLF